MLLQVYYVIVYPCLQYAVFIWGCTAKMYLKQIQVLQNKIVKKIFELNKLKVKSLPLCNHLKLLKLDKIHDLEVIKFMYEMKVKSLPNVFTDHFQSIATIHSYNTRQATKNKNYQPRPNKQKKKCQ